MRERTPRRPRQTLRSRPERSPLTKRALSGSPPLPPTHMLYTRISRVRTLNLNMANRSSSVSSCLSPSLSLGRW
ncbi:MAG: hypothetical protein ACK55Z_23685, partial [bacterium]